MTWKEKSSSAQRSLRTHRRFDGLRVYHRPWANGRTWLYGRAYTKSLRRVGRQFLTVLRGGGGHAPVGRVGDGPGDKRRAAGISRTGRRIRFRPFEKPRKLIPLPAETRDCSLFKTRKNLPPLRRTATTGYGFRLDPLPPNVGLTKSCRDRLVYLTAVRSTSYVH